MGDNTNRNQKRIITVLAITCLILILLLINCHAKASRTFYSCTQARAVGMHDIPSTSPYYNAKLDADGDGKACQL